MNDRLSELTKQIQDAIGEIKTIIPTIRLFVTGGEQLCFLVSDERDIASNFPGYFRVPIEDVLFNSEVHASSNGVLFHTYSKLPVPAGVSRICVACPEREAV